MSEIKFEDFQMKYKFERELSRGSFGRVCRIREIESGDLYALKKLMVKSQSQGEDAHNEIQLMERLNHPSIVAVAITLSRFTNSTTFKSGRDTAAPSAKSASSWCSPTPPCIT